MVSRPAFDSDDPNSNLVGVHSFCCTNCLKRTKINEYFETGKTTYDGLITKFVRFLNHNFDDWNDTCQA